MFNEAQALTVLRAKLQHAGLSRTAVRRIQVVVRREMRLAGAQVFGAAFDGDDVSRFGFRF